jgi:cardiolipin synthase (CMP-forming)
VLTGNYKGALLGFVAAGFTDLVDGYLARRWRQQSIVGSWLDPLADKILVGSLVLSLTLSHLIPWWLCGIILLRDAGLVFGSLVYRYRDLPAPRTWESFFDMNKQEYRVEVHPTIMGKLNTVLQVFVVAVSLASPIYGFQHHPLVESLYSIVAGTTIISGVQYLFYKNAFQLIKK